MPRNDDDDELSWDGPPVVSDDVLDAEIEFARKLKRAAATWRRGEPILGTPADAYLRARAIDLRKLPQVPEALRFVARCREPYADVFWPAMVARIALLHGPAIGVHRTYLEHRDGAWRKAPILRTGKAVQGGMKRGFIRLADGRSGLPIEQAPAGDVVAIAEGIENGFSVALARPAWRVIAGVSVQNLRAIELPEGVEVILIADNDAPGSEASKAVGRAVDRFLDLGHRVCLLRPPEGSKDWNDERQRRQRETADV